MAGDGGRAALSDSALAQEVAGSLFDLFRAIAATVPGAAIVDRWLWRAR